MQSINQLKSKKPWSFFNKTQQGFTLLEVMLALVIISTIAVFSIGMLQQQAVNAQIDKTALQMQQWLEAAKAYYVDNNQWPNGAVYNVGPTACVNLQGYDPTVLLLEGKCGPLAQDNKIYIQSGTSIEQNAWGQKFQLLPPALQPNQNSSMFQVVSPVPAKVKNALTIAQRLAGRLPNAIVGMLTLDAPLSVIAGVTIPGTSSILNGIMVISMQMFECDRTAPTCATIKKPVCPPSMTPHIYPTLQGFVAPPPGVPASLIGPVYVYTQDTNNQSWDIELDVRGPNSVTAHQGTILIMTTCEKSQQMNNTSTGMNFTY